MVQPRWPAINMQSERLAAKPTTAFVLSFTSRNPDASFPMILTFIVRSLWLVGVVRMTTQLPRVAGIIKPIDYEFSQQKPPRFPLAFGLHTTVQLLAT